MRNERNIGHIIILLMAVLQWGCNIQQQDLEEVSGNTKDTMTVDIILPAPPAPLILIPPFVQMSINDSIQFTAEGGVPPYAYSKISGPGTLTGDTFLAPGTPGSTIIRVVDSVGTPFDGLVTIDEELILTPPTKKLNINTSFQFTASGGNPPYSYSIISGGGSFDNNAKFTAPGVSGTTILRVVDNRGSIKTSNVTTGNGPIIAPAILKMPVSSSKLFTVTSGTGPFTWVVTQGAGTFDGGLQTYTTPNAFATFTATASLGTSVVRVTDSALYSSEATIETFKVNKIATTTYSTCALKGNTGEVKCWGQNEMGQLGNGGMVRGDHPNDMGDNVRPVILASAEGTEPIDVSVGANHVCSVRSDGLVQCWGYSCYGNDGANWCLYDSNGANRMGDNIAFVPIGLGRTIKEIESGYYTTCALMDDDNVKCWGQNWYGNLGQDNGAYLYSNTLYNAPNVFLGQTVKKLTVGHDHNCVILLDDTVKCWGLNDYGQLGRDNLVIVGSGAGEMTALTSINLGGSTAIDISAGRLHSCAVLSNGNVRCWGYNAQGQLGQGHAVSKGGAPGDMASLTDITFAGRTAVKVTVGYYHTCALLDNGTVRCWGYNNEGQLGYGDMVNRGDNPGEMSTLTAVPLGTGRTAISIAASNSQTCAILDNQTLKCWGYNAYGQLGLGHKTNIGTLPEHMGDNLPAVNLGTGVIPLKISKSSSGSETCVLALKDGAQQVLCWGQGYYGQLGDLMGSIGIRSSDMGVNLPAVDLGAPSNGQIKDISPNYYGYCATMNDNTVKCWGYNEPSYRIAGSNSPETYIGDMNSEVGSGIPFLNAGLGVKALSVQGSQIGPTACGIFDDLSLKCWGYNGYGQLGQDNTANYTYIPTTAAINLGVGRTATQFSVGTYHVCARLDDASVKCWGSNEYGELGKGDVGPPTRMGNEPGEMAALAPIDLGTGRTAKSICAGYYQSCAILDNDKLKCWGYNGYGQLGVEDTATRGDAPGEMGDSLPYINLGTGRSAKKVSCGINYTCAILDNDKLKCWGYNGYGNLGLGHTGYKGNYAGSMGDLLPYVDVGTGRTVVDVQAGYYHTCAVLDNNDVKCWGWNHRGQLGLGKSDIIGNDPGEMGDNLAPVDF